MLMEVDADIKRPAWLACSLAHSRHSTLVLSFPLASRAVKHFSLRAQLHGLLLMLNIDHLDRIRFFVSAGSEIPPLPGGMA